MEIAWTIVTVVVPIAFGMGVGVLGFAPPEFKIARGCFWLSAALLGGMNLVWQMQTNATLWWRIIVGGSIGLLVGVGLPLMLHWVTVRQNLHQVQTPTSGNLVATRAPAAAPRPTLATLFAGDFPNTIKLTTDTNLGFADGSHYTVKSQIYLETQAGSKFFGFYVPNNPKLFGACIQLSKMVLAIMNDLNSKIEMGGKLPGENMQDYRKLAFSGRVYLYYDGDFTHQQLGQIESEYQKHGMTVVLRGRDYLVSQLVAKPQ